MIYKVLGLSGATVAALAAGWLVFSLRPAPARAADRVKEARAEKSATIKQMVKQAGLSYPAHHVLIRVFKLEKELEVWGRDKSSTSYKKIVAYPICMSAGEIGPKYREGDGQVPEGIYYVNRFNPQSMFHLSLGLDYPNKSDRLLAYKADPGSDIFIHGACVSIGCVPIQDGPIEELYIMAIDSKIGSGKRPSVHMLPCRFGTKACEKTLAPLASQSERNRNLYEDLRAIHAAFEKDNTLPEISIDGKGRYKIKS